MAVIIARSCNTWFGTRVAQRAGLLVEFAAMLDADGFGDGDLNVLDLLPVPQRLEQAVGLAKRNAMMFCTVSLPRKWSIR